jgi:hypothetical protein
MQSAALVANAFDRSLAPIASRSRETAETSAQVAGTNGVMWINIQKTFGPVTIEKVGFSYQNGFVFVMSNLALASGGLEIDLIGLGIGSSISHPGVEFTIQGLAVSFVGGPVTIMGAMLGTIDPLNFVGAISIQVPEFALNAFGGYAEYQGHPSLFLYGILDAPLGGPAFFFVTGVAAGFGFNRKLLLPDITQVADFPFVAWAVGANNPPTMDPTQPLRGQVEGVLTRLANQGMVAPSVGDYWLAAGVRFTCFELLQSFALLTASLGADFEVALLGLSTLQIPPEEPVAQVQIALKVSYSTKTGLLGIAGRLTNNSYIFSRACRLTGGFAFYTWFGPDHAGEVVLTFGGYNPNFNVPSYYPAIPRLGMNWQVTPELTIQGGLYFALTSNAVMAGGSMSAVWNSGAISAWFTVWADFLITFMPFHYYIDAGIDLGASFSVDLWFCTVSITIHIGVNLVIWGPEFAGRATIDLDIISFTISFNADNQQNKNTTVAWSEMVSQLLPSQSSTGKSLQQPVGRRFAGVSRAMSLEAPAPPAAVVQINVGQGLIKTLDNSAADPIYLVNGETFQCVVTSAIPVKTATFASNVSLAPQSMQPVDQNGHPIAPNTVFGAGPAGLQPSEFNPSITLDVETQEDSNFVAVYRFNNAPKALWENKTFDANGVPQVDPKTTMTQTVVPNTIQGFTLIPVVNSPDYTLPIPLKTLLFTLENNIQPFAWSTASYPTTDSFTSHTVASTIVDPAVSSVRTQILSALSGQGIALDTTVQVQSLSNPDNDDLSAAPYLRLLGEQRAAV